MRPYIFCFLFFAINITAQTTQKIDLNIENQIDTLIEQYLHQDKIVGLSIGIVKNGQVFLTKGYGMKKKGENNPVDTETNFLTCSISKLFTATAIMQLVEQEKMGLQDKFIKYVPEFTMTDVRYKDITIYQMLTHTAGFDNYYKPDFIKPKHDSTALTEFAHKLKSKKLLFPPGVPLSAKTYSNTGYNLLGLVIERVSGLTFSEYVVKNVLQPVGMVKSSFFIDSIEKSRRSTPHKKHWLTKKVVVSNYYPDIPQDKPCGNLNSNIDDLCKWIVHNLLIFNTKQRGVIKANILESMWTTKEGISGKNTSIGLGWWIVDSKKYSKYLFHVGNDPGFSATLMVFPDKNFGIVVLCNGMYAMNDVWNKIPFEIVDLFKNDWKQ